MGLLLPPLRGATAGCGSGHLMVDGAAAFWPPLEVPELWPELSDFELLLSLDEPHPAANKAAVAATTAGQA
jgi:hypothetical protein